MTKSARKFRIQTLLNGKAGILAFGISFACCFFVGIFWNPPITTQAYDQEHRFYINRGLPVAWAGVSQVDKAVEFPIVKAPFLTRKLGVDNSSWVKVIDLRVFVPLFATIFVVGYLLAFPFAKVSEEIKGFRIILVFLCVLLFLLNSFLYFAWFPRI